jgi:hypothetical protein
MKATQPQSITSLPISPDEERRARVTKYVILMSMRFICFIPLFFVHGWWLLVFAVAVIVLPYIAVVVANNVTSQRRGEFIRPEINGVIVPFAQQPATGSAE